LRKALACNWLELRCDSPAQCIPRQTNKSVQYMDVGEGGTYLGLGLLFLGASARDLPLVGRVVAAVLVAVARPVRREQPTFAPANSRFGAEKALENHRAPAVQRKLGSTRNKSGSAVGGLDVSGGGFVLVLVRLARVDHHLPRERGQRNFSVLRVMRDYWEWKVRLPAWGSRPRRTSRARPGSGSGAPQSLHTYSDSISPLSDSGQRTE